MLRFLKSSWRFLLLVSFENNRNLTSSSRIHLNSTKLFYSEAAMGADRCSGQPSLPELCHFGFRKWGLWRGYIFLRCIRGRINRGAALLWDLLLPIYRGHLHGQVAKQITWMSKWTTRVLASTFRCPTHPSAGTETGGAGLLGVVGDGCSCFSMVNLTSSCLQNNSVDSFRTMEEH